MVVVAVVLVVKEVVAVAAAAAVAGAAATQQLATAAVVASVLLFSLWSARTIHDSTVYRHAKFSWTLPELDTLASLLPFIAVSAF